MLTRLFALIATLFASTAVRAAEPLQPMGKWIVNFDEAQCVAHRNYGSMARPIYLTLKAPALGSVIQLSVITKSGRSTLRQSNALLTFGNRPAIQSTILSFRGEKADLQAHLINLPAVHLPLLTQEQTLAIRSRPPVDYRFALSQMEPLLKIMDQCVIDLRKHWNIDEQSVAMRGQRETGPPDRSLAGLFNAEDYPVVALDRDMQGSSTFVVLVGLDGKIADCAITETSGVAALDSQSCAIIRERARLKPAIGPDGKPARSGFQQQVSWRLM